MKGQGLSLTTMAIAVLVILVIVVVAVIFGNVIGKIVPGIEDQAECRAQPGAITTKYSDGCYDRVECDNAGGTATFGLGCEGERSYCCIKHT